MYPKILLEETNKGYEYLYGKEQEKVTNKILLDRARVSQKKKIIQLNETIYQFRGYGISNMIIIDTEEGFVLIDTLVTKELSQEAKRDLERITGLDKKVIAVFYTHWHGDHWAGVKAWITEEDARSGKVDVIAQDLFEGGLIAENLISGVAMVRRAEYMYAIKLGQGGLGQLETGLGSCRGFDGSSTLVLPTETFDKEVTKNYGGIEITAFHTPGETADQNSVYIKNYNLFITSDNFYDSFPNIYTIRGAKARDPRDWAVAAEQAIDFIKEKKIEILVRQHDEARYGHDEIIEYLEDYHDAIKYLHDQTVRLMNNGLRADEIANELKYPEKFHRHGIYEFYGSYYHCIRNVYNMYLGWYSGEPSELGEVSRPERGKRLTALMGRDKLVAGIEKAKADGDLQWAAELAAYLVSYDLDNQESKNIKAEIFEALGTKAINATWRNAYMTGAYELRYGIPAAKAIDPSSPDVLKAVKVGDFIDVLATKIVPENLMDENFKINLGVGSEEFVLTVRSGVLARKDGFSTEAKLTLKFDNKGSMVAVFGGAVSPDDAIANGRLRIDGDISLIQRVIVNVEKQNPDFEITNK